MTHQLYIRDLFLRKVANVVQDVCKRIFIAGWLYLLKVYLLTANEESRAVLGAEEVMGEGLVETYLP